MSSSAREDIRVVVSIDFGTTYSGYGFAHISNPEDIIIENKWLGHVGYKDPTIIKYEDDNSTVKSWGSLAFLPRKNSDKKPIDLFKLYLLKEPSMELPELPNYKKTIIDYLKKLGEKVKENINSGWKLNFYDQVLIVLTVPTEFDDEKIEIMRDCAYKAELTKKQDSRNLIFITEPEAAAIHCFNSVDDVRNLKHEESFMVVDCGGGTVDLTCHEILANDRIGEITESRGGCYGSSFVDRKFIEFLGRKLGKSAIELLKKEYYYILYDMVQEFCEYVKLPFTGQESDFCYEMELEEYPLKRTPLKEKADETITLEFDDVKEMFDPLITNIISLIRGQLDQLRNKNKKCSVMMLVGGFSESKYLQGRIEKEFNQIVPKIAVPPKPIIAVLKGGVQFGLKVESVVKRILKRTYGTNVIRKSRLGDPSSEMLPNGYTVVFETIESRGKEILVNDEIVKEFKLSSSTQRNINFNIYVTKEPGAKFCNDPGVSLLRRLEIELPDDDDDDDDDDYDDVIISLTLTFGTVEILATAKNKKTGESYRINQKPGVKIRI